MQMTNDRWQFTNSYSREVFGAQDDHLAALMEEAEDAGLPGIAVTADVGRLLKILASMTRGKLALELGTLGGYSGIWITRGLAPDGRLITIEQDPHHAEFAKEQFERAGLGDRVEVRLGAALDVLPDLADELGPVCVDVAFFDAEKTEYPDYFRLVRPLIAPGGLLLADNVYGTGGTWIDDLAHPGIRATDQLNRMVADAPEFEAVAIPMRSGILIARKTPVAD